MPETISMRKRYDAAPQSHFLTSRMRICSAHKVKATQRLSPALLSAKSKESFSSMLQNFPRPLCRVGRLELGRDFASSFTSQILEILQTLMDACAVETEMDAPFCWAELQCCHQLPLASHERQCLARPRASTVDAPIEHGPMLWQSPF